MLGYFQGSKAYRLWDPAKHKIVKSRDVLFNKHIFPKNAKELDKPTFVWPDSDSESEVLVEDCPNPVGGGTPVEEPGVAENPTLPKPRKKCRTEAEMLGPAEERPRLRPRPTGGEKSHC